MKAKYSGTAQYIISFEKSIIPPSWDRYKAHYDSMHFLIHERVFWSKTNRTISSRLQLRKLSVKLTLLPEVFSLAETHSQALTLVAFVAKDVGFVSAISGAPRSDYVLLDSGLSRLVPRAEGMSLFQSPSFRPAAHRSHAERRCTLRDAAHVRLPRPGACWPPH